MATKNKKSVPSTVVRSFYDPAIREAIAEGNLAKMKRIHAQATALLAEQGNLSAAVKRLAKAIAKLEG
jgi:hypothetical protein